MASDPSIYGQVGANVVQPVNPLAMYGQTAQTANALLGVQQVQRQLAAQTGEQQAYAGALDPATGNYDAAKLQAGLSKLPIGAGAAVAGGQALQQAQQVRGIQAQGHVNQTLTSMAALPDSAMNPQTLQAGLDALKSAGSISPQDEQAALADMPPAGSDASAYRQYLMRHTVANLAGPQAVQQIYGSNTEQNQGGALLSGVTASPMMGGGFKARTGTTLAPGPQYVNTGQQNIPTSGGIPLANGVPISNTTSPETQASLVTIQDPHGPPGQMITVPRSMLPNASGQAPGGGLPPALVGPNGIGNGRNAKTGAVSPLAPGGIIQGADPNAAASNSADVAAYKSAQQGVPVAQTDIQTLGHALDALKVLQTDTVGSGVGSTTKHAVMAKAAALGLLPDGYKDDLTTYDLAKKNLTRYAASQGTAAHSDLGLSTAAASNASVDNVTNDAAQTVVKQELGKRMQAIAAVNEAPNATGVGFSNHMAQFTQKTDPRAFAFDSYTPAERQKIVQSLGDKGSPAYTNFVNTLAIAHKNNFITPPGAQGGN